MLSKKQRLIVSEVESLKEGKSVFTTLISLRFKPASEFKATVSVSKKVAARAVDRNKIRRRTYAVLRNLVPAIKVPVFAMLMPKKEFLTATPAVILRELKALFEKARLL